MAEEGARPEELVLVYASWCPHCVPVSTDALGPLALRWNVGTRLLDIDVPNEEAVADRLVELHGDWTPDYLIPQLFLRWSDGQVQHLLTGTPGSVAATTRSWQRLLAEAPDPKRPPYR